MPGPLGRDALVALVAARVAAEFQVQPSALPGLVEALETMSWASAPAEPFGGAPGPLPAPPGGWANPRLVGVVHEWSLAAEVRKGRGAWYTPSTVVAGLVRFAAHLAAPTSRSRPDVAPPDHWAAIVDPTCGGGAFLIGGLDFWLGRGCTPTEAVGRIAGLDIDSGATAASRWAVALWAASHGVDPGQDLPPGWELAIGCGDSLLESWPSSMVAGESPVLVAGNPPFVSPLKSHDYGRSDLLGPYADLAARHLLHALGQVPAGSSVVLVQPQSLFSARDIDGLRREIDRSSSPWTLAGMWATPRPVFDAGVRVCAPVIHTSGPQPLSSGPATVAVAAEPDVQLVGSVDHLAGESTSTRWGQFGTTALGAPLLPPALRADDGGGGRRLGQLIEATAGFRDEYYAMARACVEGPSSLHRPESSLVGQWPLVTVGAVDPLMNWWGQRDTRFAGKTWRYPRVDQALLEAESEKVGRWVRRQLRPKVLLATQTKVLEPYVDRHGICLPATPMLAVHCEPDDVDLVAAVLLAPPVVLWAWTRWFGAALAPFAIKLAARDVAELPLPSDNQAWQEAAALVRLADGAQGDEAAALALAVATTMNAAYAGTPDLVDWWAERAR